MPRMRRCIVTLPVRLVKQLNGECCYSGCDDEALDGSDFCAPHDAHERGRAANRQRRHRQRLANAGLCIAGCGRKVARQRGPDRKIRRRRCATCRKAHSKAAQEARKNSCVTGDARGVTGDGAQTVDKWRPDFDPVTGAEWARYRGKGRRGRLTREEQLDELKRDMLFAIEKAKDCVRSIETLKSPEIQQLPSIQRGAAYREVADLAGQSSRLAESVEDALKGDT